MSLDNTLQAMAEAVRTIEANGHLVQNCSMEAFDAGNDEHRFTFYVVKGERPKKVESPNAADIQIAPRGAWLNIRSRLNVHPMDHEGQVLAEALDAWAEAVHD